MKIAMKVVVKNVDPQVWADSNNGPWPEDGKRSLSTAVRDDIKGHVQHILSQISAFEELDIEVEVQ